MENYTDPTIREIKRQEIRLWQLSRIRDAMTIKDVSFVFKADQANYSLTEKDLPFDLSNELRVLVADAMDLIKNDIERMYNGIKSN